MRACACAHTHGYRFAIQVDVHYLCTVTRTHSHGARVRAYACVLCAYVLWEGVCCVCEWAVCAWAVYLHMLCNEGVPQGRNMMDSVCTSVCVCVCLRVFAVYWWNHIGVYRRGGI